LYEVAEGDTLNRIAQRYGLEVPEILRANDLETSELIVPGQELILPGARSIAAQSSQPRSEPPVVAESSNPAAAQAVPAREVRQLASSLEARPAASAALSSPAAAAPLPPVARPTFSWPASGPITTYFGEIGWASPRGHSGLDI